MKSLQYIFAILFINLAFLGGTAFSQERQPLFHTVDEQNGLVNDLINCIEVDDYGYIWIGCKSGLCRYDGQNFKIFSANGNRKTNIVSGNTIADIEKDKSGRIWIATERGVSNFNTITGQFSFVPLVLDDGKIKSSYQADKILVNNAGEIYFYSSYSRLYVFDSSDSTFRAFYPEVLDKLKSRYCYIDNTDNFWLLSDADRKIYKMSSQGDLLRTINCDDYEYDTPTKGNFAFLDNGNGEVFFGGDNGFLIFSQNENKFKKLDAVNIDIFPEKETKCFFKDSRGLIWIGTNAKELFVYNPKTKYLTIVPSASNRTPYRLNSPTVMDVREDNRGLLWFGTWKGLSFTEINPSKRFHNVSNEETEILPNKNYVSAFDAYGDMIVIGCDGGGATFWQKNAVRRFDCFDPQERKGTKMRRASVLGLCYDKEGYLYNGGYNRTVTRIHPNLKDVDEYPISQVDSNYMSSDFTTSMLCDDKDRVWILTNGDGLYEVIDKKKGIVKRHNIDKNGKHLCSIWGTCLAFSDGKLYVGSYQGMTIYDIENDVFENYDSDMEDTSSLSHSWVSYILIDSKKRIWVGTSFGLNLFDVKSKTFRHIGRESGFLSDDIKGIIEDEKTGLLWVSTSKGISKFDPEKMEVVRTYLSSDGLLTENFQLRGAFKDKDGTMYFGAANGFIYFNPEEISDNIQLPMPMITGLMINYSRVMPLDKNSPLTKATEATDKIELTSDQSTFTIEFTSLNFVNEGGNRYFCFLEGYDKNWIDVGTRHEITFTNLAPGNYIFEVKCQNADGCVSDIRPLKITVKPPFYRTWWFVTLEILAMVFFVVFVYWLRTRNLKENQRKLEQMVVSRTEALTKVNAELEAQKEEILRQSQEIEHHRDELVSKNQELELNRIEITRRNEEIKKSLKNILVLNDISRQITSSFDISNIIMTAYNHVTQIVKADFFSIGIFSPSLNSLEFNYIFINNELSQAKKVPCKDDTFAERKCYMSNSDVFLTGENCKKSYFCSEQENLDLGTICLMPLRESNKANGVFVIGVKENDYYSKTDIANIGMVSSYVSIAIDKARDYQQLRSKNNAINGSIRYAKTIQDAILVDEATINKYFSGMVVFRPKDIVSGDFYWFRTIEKEGVGLHKIFAAVVDCTGHGVPGAFMSLISNTLLDDIVIRGGHYETDRILKLLDKEIVLALNQQNSENNDGLDMAICAFDLGENGEIKSVSYSGAKNALYYYNKEIDEFKSIGADRISIGGYNSEIDKQFTSKVFEVHKGDMFFMTSDGIIDQNNRERKRFSSARFLRTLTANRNEEMSVIKANLEKELDDFMSGVDQRDDISVMGLRIL